MLEDERLKWKLRRGSKEALARVYEKYIDSMLTLAMGLLNDTASAEDVMHAQREAHETRPALHEPGTRRIPMKRTVVRFASVAAAIAGAALALRDYLKTPLRPVIASAAKQSPTSGHEIASSLRSSQ